MNYREQIDRRARGVISAYLETRDRVDFAQSVKSMTDHTTHEYGGRFLLELLQNAYDAHPRDRVDGQIQATLDLTEGEHGTVYVANTGTGFSPANFRAICNLGLSDKPVGEGIGNKGVGFRSVLQVSSQPEIYSSDPITPSVDGFCFRFASPADIPALVNGDDATALEVIRDVSLYNIPIWISRQPERVRDLRRSGFATVVRLPLRSAVAASEALSRFSDLQTSNVPVLLFLDRLTLLSVDLVTDDGSLSTLLERSIITHHTHGDLTTQQVQVGEGVKYYVFSVDIDPARLQSALRRAVEAERLDSRWLEWNVPASVSVAAPVEHDIADFRSYTYLPMGPKALAPFAGHLNAPFFTNLARVDLDLEHPLNEMLLDVAAELTLLAAEELQHLGGAQADAAAVDLLSWRPSEADHLESAAARTGDTLAATRALLPGSSGIALSMSDAWRWPLPGAEILNAELAHAATGTEFLAETLGDTRLARLENTMAALGTTQCLSPAALADVVEQMAVEHLSRSPVVKTWDLLYDDITRLFSPGDAAELHGRRILLTDAAELRPCAQRGVQGRETREIPFFPPVRQVTEDEDEVDPDVDLNLPASLERRLFYVHAELSWYDENRQQTATRRFFQDNRLVRRFDARSLLEHLRAVLSNSMSVRVHTDALRFVYNLQRGRARAGSLATDIGLRIQNRNGDLIPASGALFSRGWPGTMGADLELISTAPGEISPDLAALKDRLLPSPAELLRRDDNLASWTEFLIRMGVGNALPIAEATDSRHLYGQQLRADSLAQLSGLPAEIASRWQQHLPARYAAWHPETPYLAGSPVYWLPGQSSVHLLATGIRSAYARLLVSALPRLGDSHLMTTWERDRPGNKDPNRIPTPLAMFLSQESWIPLHDPQTGADSFGSAQDSWHYSSLDSDPPPRFSPVISNPARALIDRDPLTLNRLREAGVGLWTSDADSRRLVGFLGSLLARGTVRSGLVRPLLNSYHSAWAAAVRQQGAWPDRLRPEYIIVKNAGVPEAVALADLALTSRIVVADRSDDTFLVRLIEELDERVMVLDSAADVTAQILQVWIGERCVRIDELETSVVIDGAPFVAAASLPRLVTQAPWLPLLLRVLVEHRWPGHQALSQRVVQEMQDALQRVRLVFAKEISIDLGGRSMRIPRRMRGVLPVGHREFPALVTEHAGLDTVGWEFLETASEALAQLIGHEQLAPQLELAFAKLRRTEAAVQVAPSNDDLADACGVEVEDVIGADAALTGALTLVLERLVPVIYHYAGRGAATHFDPAQDLPTTEEDVLAELRQIEANWPGTFPVAADQLLIAAQQAADLDSLRIAIGATLSEINHTLAAMEPARPPIDYTMRHEETFGLHVLGCWPRLTDQLRWARLEVFRARTPIAGWTTLRDRNSLRPDPAWGLTFDTLDERTMTERAQHQLSELLGGPPPPTGPELPSIHIVRENNALEIGRLAPLVARTVRAWCATHAESVPAALRDSADERSLVQLLDSAGALDFEPLDLASLLTWAGSLGAWPSSMPLTMDCTALGLTEQDLDAEQNEVERQQEERQRARRTVAVDGVAIDVGGGYDALRQQLIESLERSPDFVTTRARFARLEPMIQSVRRGGGGVSRPSKGTPRGSETQRNAIGFAGEWLAYRWLSARHKAVFTDDCWVSANRARHLPGSPGDDGLGYDFSVPSPGGPLLYEVKATIGPPGEFMLGESEIRAAQQYAGGDRWRLIVITEALSAGRELRLLNNPFRTRSRGTFSFAGQGLRVQYRPSRT